MPPKPLPTSYIDTGKNVPDVESRLLTQALEGIVNEGWEFLNDAQLDANYEEWHEAARPLLPNADNLSKTEAAIARMSLLHVGRADDLPDILETGRLTSHRYRIGHKDEYPGYRPRYGYPVDYEAALGLDDYVCFSHERYSHFKNKNLGGISFLMPARQLLKLEGTLVTPFDVPLYLSSTVFNQRPSIIQASILRGQDYLKLLPAYIAATDNRLGAARIYPAWFRQRFGELTQTAAEIKVKQEVDLGEVEWGIRYNSRDPYLAEVHNLIRDLGSKAIDEASI